MNINDILPVVTVVDENNDVMEVVEIDYFDENIELGSKKGACSEEQPVRGYEISAEDLVEMGFLYNNSQGILVKYDKDNSNRKIEIHVRGGALKCEIAGTMRTVRYLHELQVIGWLNGVDIDYRLIS